MNIHSICTIIQKRILLVIICLFIGLSFHSVKADSNNSIRRYKIHQIKKNKDLSYNSVTKIIQDKDGYIWIGTLKGLNRYDGNEMKNFYECEDGLQSNTITALLEIEEGLLIGNESGLDIYNIENEKYSHITSDETGKINDIQQLSDNKIALGAKNGLFLYDLIQNSLVKADSVYVNRISIDKLGNLWAINRKSIKQYNSNGRYMLNLNKMDGTLDFTPSAIFTDSKGRIWMGTRSKGLYIHNRKTNDFIPYIIKGVGADDLKYIRCITEDKHNNIWIGTENGVFIYNTITHSCTHHTKDRNNNIGLNDNAIYDIYCDESGSMWIGTFFGGVNITSTHPDLFQEITDEKGDTFLEGAAVSVIFHDSQDRMWYASENKGLFIQDLNTLEYKKINKDTYPRIGGNNIHAVAEDPWGNIWVGTFVEGIYKFNNKLNTNPTVYRSSQKPNSLKDNSIYSLLADNKDTLYIGTSTGIEVMDYKTGSFKKLKPEIFDGKRVDSFLRDYEGTIWISTHFDGIYQYVPESGTVINYKEGMVNCKNMQSDLIFCSMLDSKNNLWFGTNNGGIIKYDKNTKQITSYGYDNALKHRDIYYIEEDSYGVLWMSTDRGIYSFDPATEEFKNYIISSSSLCNQFNYNSGYKDYIQGVIYFGSTSGACHFEPEEINQSEEKNLPDILFNKFKIHGNEVKPEDNGILQKNINYTDKLTLSYNQNSISINIGYIDYNQIEHKNFQFQYKLSNAEYEWNTASNPQTCNYGNLRSGHYTFDTRIVSNDGSLIKTKSIEITVKPHILLSPLFVIIYFLLGFVIMLGLLYIYKNRLKDKMDLKLEQVENKNLETLNRHRINFFTYISHEFKSPLTILMAIFDDIGKTDNQRNITKEEIEIIRHNTRRLMFLINQLMEFRSIETNHSPMKYVKGDIIEYCKRIFEQFHPLFKNNGLVAEFNSSVSEFETKFDNDKLDKIISNLLSNAIKHTISHDDKTDIIFSVNINSDKREISFNVFNYGSYISDEQKESIMQPFFKTETTKEYSYNNGIGLALVKELVDMQNGRINITSDLNKGTSFEITIPFAQEEGEFKQLNMETSYTKNTADIISNTIYDMNMINSQKTDANVPFNENGEFTIIVVDDNPEISHLLKSKLKENYKVKRASNGIDALEIIQNYNIDVIVSDIIMPKMNGYELCMRIKNDDNLKHIPIILMTSESSKESQIKSLKVGADDYINKPFSIEELNLRIQNLLNSKKSMKEYYSSISSISIETNTSNKDETFIKQLNGLIIDNLKENDITVDFIAEHMNISRTQLYLRLKSITDMSATAYVNNIKINIAKEKLINEDLTVAEIAWELGFNSPNYFSKTFKKYVGMTPAEYKKHPHGDK